ncbi:PTS glucose transporter subunit IIA, partial [Staphylococcus sp. SIMBA_130]
ITNSDNTSSLNIEDVNSIIKGETKIVDVTMN